MKIKVYPEIFLTCSHASHIVGDHRSIWCSQNWSLEEDKRLSNCPCRNLHVHSHCSWRMVHNFFVAFFIAWGSHSRWMSWNWSPLWIQILKVRCYGMELPKHYFPYWVNHAIQCVVYLRGKEKYEQKACDKKGCPAGRKIRYRYRSRRHRLWLLTVVQKS